MKMVSGSNLKINATMVANEFIDRHMAGANGEYVKVYLYLMRHEGEDVSVMMIADALNHTESDVNRALSYWSRAGVLTVEQEAPREQPSSGVEEAPLQTVALPRVSRPPYPPEEVGRLTGDEDFSQLLYIAQKYMNKVFTQRECEVFAYLYGGLHMSLELLEYLVEFCVQGGHTSIRYIETVGLNWHEKGLTTAEEAKAYSMSFTRDSFAVMKAFGLTDRKPGASEKEMIEKWVKEYGFAKEVILEACNRTMEAIHTPSFKYADKILSEWKKAGVKSLSDVNVLDQRRKPAGASRPGMKKPAANQFHNFSQRETDYDAMVLQNVRGQQ